MTSAVTQSPLALAALVFGLAGIVLVLASLLALVRAQLMPFVVRVLLGGILLSLGSAAGTLAVGVAGYRALTQEEVAARVKVRPIAPQRFHATVQFADGREIGFEVAGDEIYVDAHVLKWKPLGNLLGLHTAYELDRLGGRYRAIEQERSAPRTIHSLAPTRWVNLFDLRQRHAVLEPLLDAEYGSATFVAVTRPTELELRISTSGLLLREAKPVTK